MEALPAELRERIASVQAAETLPVPPTFGVNERVPSKLRRVQKFINEYEYNYTGESYFVLRRDRGMSSVMETCKEIIREALPIQCVEGVFLGVYLTSSMPSVLRIPISFKSEVDGQVFRHIVLAVRYDGRWGALGISRKRSLMYKELKYDSLSALVAEFQRAYRAIFHSLVKVYAGFPVPHDLFSMSPLQWRVLHLDIGADADAWQPVLDEYGRRAMGLFEHYVVTGQIPDELGQGAMPRAAAASAVPSPTASAPASPKKRRRSPRKRRVSSSSSSSPATAPTPAEAPAPAGAPAPAPAPAPAAAPADAEPAVAAVEPRDALALATSEPGRIVVRGLQRAIVQVTPPRTAYFVLRRAAGEPAQLKPFYANLLADEQLELHLSFVGGAAGAALQPRDAVVVSAYPVNSGPGGSGFESATVALHAPPRSPRGARSPRSPRTSQAGSPARLLTPLALAADAADSPLAGSDSPLPRAGGGFLGV